jgi:glycosyltransferase involved in cell wall biosynthesis
MHKVLHILWGGDVGKANEYVKKLVSSKSKEVVKHHIFLVTKEGSVLNSTCLLNTPIISASCTKFNQINYCRDRINEAVLEWEIDLIHCHTTNVFVMNQLPSIEKCKIIMTDHGEVEKIKDNEFIIDSLWKMHGQYISQVILPSRELCDQFNTNYPELRHCSTALKNPYENSFKNINPSLGKDKNIGFIGNLEIDSGADRFVCMAAMIHASSPRVKFNVYGVGRLEAHLKQLASHLNLNEVISFHGDDLDESLAIEQMDLLMILNGSRKNIPRIIEAMAKGIPVLGPKNSGFNDYIKSGVNGYLCNKNDLPEFGETANLLLQNESDWKGISNAAINFVDRELSFEKHNKALCEIYNAVIDSVSVNFADHMEFPEEAVSASNSIPEFRLLEKYIC